MDTSDRRIDYSSSQIVSFLFHTVNQLKIGVNDTLVSLYTYDIRTKEVFDLTAHTDRFALLRALQTTHFHGGIISSRPDINSALEVLIQYATTPNAGDRPGYRDVIVFIADAAHAGQARAVLAQRVKNLSNDVIIVGVGGPSNGNLEQLATDTNHIFHASNYATLELEAVRDLAAKLVSCQ